MDQEERAKGLLSIFEKEALEDILDISDKKDEETSGKLMILKLQFLYKLNT